MKQAAQGFMCRAGSVTVVAQTAFSQGALDRLPKITKGSWLQRRALAALMSLDPAQTATSSKQNFLISSLT